MAATGQNENKKRKFGLTSIIMIALGLGIVCGVVFHYCIPAGTHRTQSGLPTRSPRRQTAF